jgi:hypothetical protein
VLRDLCLDHLGAQLPYCRESTILVLAHKTAVADHIGRKNGGQAALDGIL